jgi:hypothetical protein
MFPRERAADLYDLIVGPFMTRKPCFRRQKNSGIRGFLHAPEWTRTTTGKTPHKALNLAHRE